MTSNRTRANYDELSRIAQLFAGESENTARMMQSIRQCLDTLQGGDWIGQGARAFYQEMNQEVLPALNRLAKALASASKTTRAIGMEVKQAEDASAGLLNGRDVDGRGSSVGVGASGSGSSAAGAGGAAGAGSGNSPSTADAASNTTSPTGSADGGATSNDAGHSATDSATGAASGSGSGGNASGDPAASHAGPFTESDYGVGDPVPAGGSAGSGASTGGGSAGGESGGSGSGGGQSPAGQLDDLDQAIASGDPARIASVLKLHLLQGDTRAMEKFRRLSATSEIQVANDLLLSLSSTELNQLSTAPASQQAMNELSNLRR